MKNIDLKQLAGPLKHYYDRALALGIIVVLLVSVLFLIARSATATIRQHRFKESIKSLTPAFPDVPGVSRQPFDDGKRAVAEPPLLDTTTWTNRLVVPEKRVACVGAACRRPILYAATVCESCGEKQAGKIVVIDDNVDRDGDGILDAWEEKYGLDKMNLDDAAMDADLDGFSNLQEYNARDFSTNVYPDGSNPKDPESIPPIYAHGNLVVLDIATSEFNLMFMSAMKSGKKDEDGKDILKFGINNAADGRTYWRKLGETVLGFELKSFEKKAIEDEKIKGRMIDVSELTLQSGDKHVVLQVNKRTQHLEKAGSLFYKPAQAEIPIIEGKEFMIKKQKYTVKSIDAEFESVILSDLTLQEEVTIVKPTL